MNINDVEMPYIILEKKDFKSKTKFADILSFLDLPKEADTIIIPIDKGRIEFEKEHNINLSKKEVKYERF